MRGNDSNVNINNMADWSGTNHAMDLSNADLSSQQIMND
jgi:hypothetical protein